MIKPFQLYEQIPRAPIAICLIEEDGEYNRNFFLSAM